MMTVTDLIEKIGRDEFMDRLQLIREQVWAVENKTNKFPSSWYDSIEQLCLDKGIECPRNLFSWRDPALEARKRNAVQLAKKIAIGATA